MSVGLPISIDEIKKRRANLGFSQDALAKRAGVYQSQVCRIEAGRQGIDILVYFKIVHALGYRFDVRIDYQVDLEVKVGLQHDRAKKRAK